MKYKILTLIALFLTDWEGFYAQTLQLGGEIRNRGELREGFRKPLADSLHPLYVHNLRVKLHGLYSSSKIKAKASLIDSKIFSSDHSVRTDNYFGLYEIWGEYFFTPEFSVVLGRQTLEYDDNRLFSAGNWGNTSSSHDLVRIKYESSQWKAHVGGGWNNASESLYNVKKTYESLFYGWGTYSFKEATLSGIWVNEGFKKKYTEGNSQTSIYRNTLGGNVTIKNKESALSLIATGYYQFGYNQEDKKLDAFFGALKADYELSNKITATLGGEYYSGTRYDASKNKDYTFNKLYGANHSFNGSIEYWSTLPAQGLLDLYGGLKLIITPKLSCNAVFHSFAVTQKIEGRNKKGIGSEFDIIADYKLSPSFSIQGGWNTYIANKGTDILKKQVDITTRFPQWGYIMITFKPVFFSKKITTK